MRLTWNKCLPLLLLLSFARVATANEQAEKSLDRYYNNLFLGEKKTIQYNGPLAPEAIFTDEIGDLEFKDDQISSH